MTQDQARRYTTLDGAPLAQRLPRVLQQFAGAREFGSALHQIQRWWPDILPQWHTQAVPETLRRGTLSIVVASASAKQQFVYWCPQLLAQLNQRLGRPQVQRVKLRVGVLPNLPTSAAKSRPTDFMQTVTIPPEVCQSWSCTRVAMVRDPELQAVLQRLGARIHEQTHLKT